MKKVSLGTVWCAYQPPVQLDEIVQKVDRECYSPVFKWLSENNGLKVNIAINRSVGELLIKNNCRNTLDKLGRAVQKGSVELLGGLAYHPIAPLLAEYEHGEDEIKRQNDVNNEFSKKIFGRLWKPSGFYLPEFGYSDEVARIVKEMGYEYTVTNGLLYFEKNLRPQPFDKIAETNGLNIFFASDWSIEFAKKRPDSGDFDTHRLINDMFDGMRSWFQEKRGYTVWGYDIETIGHQQKGYGVHTIEEMAQGIEENEMQPVFLSELLGMFPEREHAEILPGTQSISRDEIYAGEFFSLWNHSRNPFHDRLRRLEEIAVAIVNETTKRNKKNVVYKAARESIDKGLNSCKTWQANPSRGLFIPFIIRRSTEKLVSGITACAMMLKDSDSRINLNGDYLNSEEIIEKAKDLEYSINELIHKEEISRRIWM